MQNFPRNIYFSKPLNEICINKSTYLQGRVLSEAAVYFTKNRLNGFIQNLFLLKFAK